MNIWDSVQRGLEKASQEASRIARTQRLRSNIDGLARQINAQQGSLINRAMEVFTAGRLTQSELIPLCQELSNLQMQLAQAQNELKQLQSQGPTTTPSTGPYPPGGEMSSSYTPPPPGSEIAPTMYAPPPGYQSYIDTIATPTPPPPPGVEPLTVSSLDTIMMPGSPPPPPPPENSMMDALNTIAMPDNPSTTEMKHYCTRCYIEILPGNAYCHNCGAPVQNAEASYLPTMKGTFDVAQPEIIHAPLPGEAPQSSAPIQPAEKDGGQ